MNKKEEIIQMLKGNPIKIIKCGDIEIPVEYLKQTIVAVNGDDYIRVQQENKILKENAENNGKVVDKVNWKNQLLKKENKQLKMINKEYERLNKEKNRGFKITNVQEYNIDKLLSYKKYKDNWNKLKDYIVKEYYMYLPLEASTKSITILIDKMQELEGSDSK